MSSKRIEIQRLEPRQLLSGIDDNFVEPATVGQPADLNGAIIFPVGRNLMKLNPLDGSTSTIKTFWNAGTYDAAQNEFIGDIQAGNLITVGSKIFFTVDDGIHGRELWKTDGTAAGTTLVKDIRSGIQDTDEANFTNFNNKLYFTADDGVHGWEPWVSDGTAAGTHIIKDIVAGATGSNPVDQTIVQGKLFFQAGTSVYRTDGTSAGTAKIADISANGFIASAGNNLFLLDDDGGSFIKSVSSTGTITTIFDQRNTNISDTSGLYAAALGSKLVFSAPGVFQKTLWITDGTSAGTKQIKVQNPAGIDIDVGDPIVATDDAVYTRVTNGQFPHDNESIWRTDGTAAGTKQVTGWADEEMSPSGFIAVGKKLYYQLNHSAFWVVDAALSPKALPIALPAEIGSDAVVVDSRTFYLHEDTALLKVRDGVLTRYSFANTSVPFAPPLVAVGEKSYAFDVTFISPYDVGFTGLEGSTQNVPDSINNNSGSGGVIVTAPGSTHKVYVPLFHVTGPNGFSRDATFVAEDRVPDGVAGRDGSIRTVTWSISAPNGTWGAADVGTYTVFTVANAYYVSGQTSGGLSASFTFTVTTPTSSTAPAILAGSVFTDFDSDGTRDASEASLAGYQAYIDSKPNGHYDTGELTATTDSKGRYSFTVPAGDYRLGLLDAKGSVGTTGILVATARPGTTVYTNFGITDSANVAGTVFDDINSSATRTASKEPGLPGIIVWDDRDGDGVPESFEPTTRTDTTGHYALTAPWGASHIRAQLPGGRRPTQLPPDVQNIEPAASATIDIGMTRKAYVTGTVFADTNSDAVQQTTETPAAGAIVYVDYNNNGQLDAGEPTGTSKSDGKYRVENIPAGTYTLRALPPGAGGAITLGKDGQTITLKAAGTIKRTFGTLPGPQIAGTVFNDRNANGSFNKSTSEGILASRTVYIDANNNSKFDAGETSCVSDANGHYTLYLPPEAQQQPVSVRLVNPSGWRSSGAGVVQASGAAGQIIAANFGSTTRVLLSGHVFEDINNDKKFTAGIDEPMFFTVFDDLNNDHIWYYDEPGSYPDDNGAWSYSPPAGTYHLLAANGVGSAAQSNGITITLTSGQSRTDLNLIVTLGD